MRFDKLMIYRRKLLKLTQASLAKSCGVCRTLVCAWESGIFPRTKYIPDICKALQIDPNTLFQWGE